MSFSALKGQDRAVALLRRAVESGGTAHALLFTGLAGVGKTTAARAVAKLINCEEPRDGDGCGKCVSCRRLDGGNHPDFAMITAEGSRIKIDQIREFNNQLGFPPVAGNWRVCVVRRAETMTEEASNAFLKTLEEPPPGNILILTASEPRDLLPTIVSRCRRVSFRPLSTDDVATVLAGKRGLDLESVRVLAGMSGGSPGRAISMHEYGFLEKRLGWLEMLDGIFEKPADEIVPVAVSLSTGEKKRGKKGSEDEDPFGLSAVLEVWGHWYRDMLVVKEGGAAGLLANPDLTVKLKNSAERFSVESLVEGMEVLDQARRDLMRMRNTTLVLEHAMLLLKRSGGGGR